MADVEALRHTVAEIIPFKGQSLMFQEQGYNTKIELYL